MSLSILWSSNAPWAATGYGNQTKLFTPRIKALGHKVAIQAWYGLEGGILNWSGMPVFPKAFHPYGQDVAGAHAAQTNANVLITLIDAWVMEPERYPANLHWCPWFPVDMDRIPPPVMEKVMKAYRPIVYSQSAKALCEQAGLDVLYVPHGVDLSVMRVLDRAESRKAQNFPADRFIVGMIAANKGTPSRKALPQSIAAFAEFRKKHKDAYLYLHTLPTQDSAGVNIHEVCIAHGLKQGEDYQVADSYGLVIGYPDEQMVRIINSFDVLLACSMGEGFGIPILEAQACGVPVITGDWTAMPEITWHGVKVALSDAEPFWTMLGAYQYMPRIAAIVDALERVYGASYAHERPPQVEQYDADYVTANYWLPVLAEIERRL